MSESDRFSSILRRIKKDNPGSAGALLFQRLREGFVSCLPDLPENLKYDIAIYFCGEYASGENIDEIQEVGDKLLEVIFLFEEDYERVEETLVGSDWSFIRECVSEFAFELDPDTLTYVMRQIVARGMMG